MFRRTKVKKSKELLKIEEDVWHIILGGVREGSKAIDEGLKLLIENWDGVGLLSNEFGNSVLKESSDWKVVDKKSLRFRVFSRANTIANMSTLPVGEDGNVIAQLRDQDWLEQLILQEAKVDNASSSSSLVVKEKNGKKIDSHNSKWLVVESDDNEEKMKKKKKKKTNHVIAKTGAK